MAYHMKQLEDESSAGAKQSFADEQVRRQQETPRVGRLLSLYVDDSVADPTPFGDVRQRAYKIMPRDTLQTTAQRMSVKPASKLALQWQAVDGLADRMRRHLRPLYVALDLPAPIQTVHGLPRWPGPKVFLPSSSGCRNGHSTSGPRRHFRNACGRTC
ncbi:hypothetical protein IC615_27560 (plasmid) [Serratia ureilytica]